MTGLERFLHYTLLAALGVLVIVSVFSGLFPDVINNENKAWPLAGVFSALFTITFYCFRIPRIEAQLENINENIAEGRVQRFATYDRFYGALQHSLGRAKKEVLLTHIRHEPPLSFKGGADYFGLVDKWATAHPEGIVLRLAAAPNDEMKKWAQEEGQKSERVTNYYFRLVEWTLPFAFINMAIIDGQEVYLAVTAGEIERTRGICIHDDEIVEYFRDYYDVLWQSTPRPRLSAE